MSWSEKAVLSVIVGRLLKFKSAADRDSGCGSGDDVDGWIQNVGAEDRWRFKLKVLQSQTGLSRRSVIEAKRRLFRNKIIRWSSTESEAGGSGPDILEPNWEFRIVETPIRNRPGWFSVEYSA